MKIQSLSVSVPAKNCVNKCAFCVSSMHNNNYPNLLEEKQQFYDLYSDQYIKRLEFARDNGCNTIMLTGDCEPQQNRAFIQWFGTVNNKILKQPFRWIEIQTTGVFLDDEYLRFLRNHVGISTISLSCSSFDDNINAQYCGMPEGHEVKLLHLCEAIKKYDFNLRLSINMTDWFEKQGVENIFHFAKDTLRADQITFRKLYISGTCPQSEWIAQYGASAQFARKVSNYIKENGRKLELLEFGAIKYSLHGMSTVYDYDCMSEAVKEELKYLVLRADCKLYSHWDDPASLVF